MSSSLAPFSTQNALLDALLAAYGLSHEKERIYEALPFGAHTLERVDVLNVMARMGYTGKPLSSRICDLDTRLLPCVFFEKKTRAMRVLTTPSSEPVRGTAYIFTKQDFKDPQAQKEALMVAGLGWFMSATTRFRGLFMRILGVSFFLNLVALALPLFLMVIYNQVADVTIPYAIYALGVGALLMLLMENALRSMRSQSLAWFAARIDNIVSNRVLSRLLQLPAYAIEGASVTSQVARLRAFDSVREFFTGPLFLTLLDLPFTLLAFLVMMMVGGKLALIPVGLLVVYAGVLWAMRSRLKLSMFLSARSRSQMQTHHIELFEKLQALRANGMSEVWLEQFRDMSASSSLDSFKAQHLAQGLETTVYALTALAGLGLLYVGVTQAWAETITGGALFASLVLFWRVIAPWQALISNLPRLEQLYRSIGQIDRLMTLDTERESAFALGKLVAAKGAIEFSKIGLRYTKDTDPVFVGLSFGVLPGEHVAIAGGNGSGKSTILKLALGLYRPQAGAVYMDGRDIRQLDPVDLRQRIAYVPQNPELFEGTLADNLRLGNPFATDFDLWQALERVDAKQHVERLPQGIHTPLVKGNDPRIAPLAYHLILARAYLKDAPIMLIDEMPYAILNSPTGTMLMEHVKKWRGEKTILMISHRDDHIAQADKAVGLLQGGRHIVNSPEKVIRQLRDEAFQDHKRVAL
jgi:ATP-binding cassette, subfamily C, bacterial LapB